MGVNFFAVRFGYLWLELFTAINGKWLWRFHKVHHSDKSFNVSTGFRFHVFDLFLEIPYKCLFVILIGVDAQLVLIIETIQLFFIFFTTPISRFSKKQRYQILSSRHFYTAFITLPCVKSMTATTALYWHFGIGCLVPAKN